MRTKILLVAGAAMMGGLQIASAADLPREIPSRARPDCSSSL